MRANYNQWFHEYNKYLTATRGDNVDHLDTKWVDINHRMKVLKDLNSDLILEQPFGIVGNNMGFSHLIDLLAKSNYTFDDIDESLADSYKKTLQSSMSNMLVNTHALMFHCTSFDDKYVSYDTVSGYYIIDVPFNQLHFGDRDEFIRQKLQEMYATSKGNYIPLQRFISPEISSLLGFSLLCSVNGYICNDWMVAIDDKGFKFKIMWIYTASNNENNSLDFGIYKLDTIRVHSVSVPTKMVQSRNIIPLEELGIKNIYESDENKCIIDIYSPNHLRTSKVLPNFGIMSKDGLNIVKLQQQTATELEKYSVDTVNLIIYELKYFHEVPNIYPATNYYNVLDNRRVYTEDSSGVVDYTELKVVSQSNVIPNKTPICTPPIVIDKDTSSTFNLIERCVTLDKELMYYENIFLKVGKALEQSDDYLKANYKTEVIGNLRSVQLIMTSLYQTYLKGAMLTSLVPNKLIRRFKEVIDNIEAMLNNKDPMLALKYDMDIYHYGKGNISNYKQFVTEITTPFKVDSLSIFGESNKLVKNFFTKESTKRFTRPIAEQCFISLKFDKTTESWLFAWPTIEHFKGIGNSFYIKDDLTGKEIFKFFVMYTDTEAPAELEIDPLKLEDVYDFDKFCIEVDNHMGYIKYWNAENKIMKLSKILYNKYDDESIVQVLSKILLEDISADDIINQYESEIKYDDAGRTTTNWKEYTLNSLPAPFAINYLFYTLSMIRDNEDKMEAYFMRTLTDRKYHPRYTDINISDVINKDITVPVNYSHFNIAPNIIESGASVIPLGKSLFYGIPYVVEGSSIKTESPYRYTFNIYENLVHYPMITQDEINPSGYVSWTRINDFNSRPVVYTNDVNVAKLVAKYLTYAYTCVSEIQTNYQKAYDIRYLIDEFRANYNTIIEALRKFDDDTVFENPETRNIINRISDTNVFIDKLDEIYNKLNNVNTIRQDSRSKAIHVVLDKYVNLIKEVFDMSGFCNSSLRRIKKLYNHLKKHTDVMNINELADWWANMDFTMIKNLASSISPNENCKVSPDSFNGMYTTLANYYVGTIGTILDLVNIFKDDLIKEAWGNHFNLCAEYCRSVYSDNIFNLFTIKEAKIVSDEVFNERPYYVQVKTTASMKHFKSPLDTDNRTYNLLFKADSVLKNNQWALTDITPVCEYAVFNDTTLKNMEADVFDKSGTHLSTIAVDMSFMKAGSSAGNNKDIDIIPSIALTTISFRNEHENISIKNNKIVSSAHADMNFELLFGNKYVQLSHEHEYVLDPSTYEEHAVEVVHIPNKVINSMLVQENCDTVNPQMFFKPSQVLHSTINGTSYLERVIESTYGKCFVGQTIYLVTDDGLSIFPATVTVIDHSYGRGFIEAEVDSYHAKWFATKDPSVIAKYLFSTIKCHVIPDNMMNFVKEYTNSEYLSYNLPSNEHNNDETPESLPGEPLFVTNNSNYVYTRLSYMFHDNIPNRFIDDDKKTYEFIFMGNYVPTYDEDGNVVPIIVNLINVETNELSAPEMYPILREEPNDHTIWDKEKQVFNITVKEITVQIGLLTSQIKAAQKAVFDAKTEYDRAIAYRALTSLIRKKERLEDSIKRINHYVEQLECPTTWYNVRSYDAAMIYIDNGRAFESPSIIVDKRDIPITDKISIFLYDWDNKVWVNPDTYTVSTTPLDNTSIESIDVKADYYTSKVMKEMTITPNTGWVSSSNIIVYLAYNKSDIYDSIPLNKNECQVRFKPILSTGKTTEVSPYGSINIRKHYDGLEEYGFDKFNANEHDFSGTGFYVKRYPRNGKYLEVPVMRMCDLSLINGDVTYGPKELKLYIKMPFDNVTTKMQYATPIYYAKVNVNIDDFVENEKVKLICISNNNSNFYNGSISSTMFEALTKYDDKGEQTLEITNSTLDDFTIGTYICSVFQCNDYRSFGGIITITISSNKENIVTSNGAWVKIPSSELYYKSLPEEFVILPPNVEAIDFSKPVTVTLQNNYKNIINDEIVVSNNEMNPFEFYFNDKENVRYPISDVRVNNPLDRLIIDTTKNTDVKVAKMTYIGIPRYSALEIPKDGLFDVTGYIPTPLSRSRYEWWVNGRQIAPSDVIILSPTSFQLINLRSLKNFELIELVDDTRSSGLMKEGNVYVDINGITYGSYRLALLSGKTMINQDIRYLFNTSNHKPIHDYTKGISSIPNNVDVETNILASLKQNDEDTKKYTEVHNTPTINGVSIYNAKTHDLGIREISSDMLIDMLDDIWKNEIITNPLFPISHREVLVTESQIILHKANPNVIGYESNDMFAVYASGISERFFTLYLSKDANGKIDDTLSTVKIIPFINIGTYILLEKKYEGLWLHCTEPNTKSIKL